MVGRSEEEVNPVVEGAASVAAELLSRARRVVALTGAGISTESGIPDFRGPEGVWTKDPSAERLATIGHYVADPEVRKAAWRSRVASPVWQAEPNAGHRALVRLEQAGRLELIVTQNTDGLHHAAGSDPSRVVEIHGTMREAVCLACGARFPMPEVLDRVRAGEEDPDCPLEHGGRRCGGILKSATISFGQALVPEDLERAQRAASHADLMLAVGTSLTVHPAAGLVPLARASGARVVIVNAEPTPYDGIADAVVGGRIGEVLPAIVDEALAERAG
jgi:NAD-dependent deacetylase